MSRQETATLAGGCFWCLEAVYEQLQGVTRVDSGYMGGQIERPTYEAVCSGETGHAEVVQLQFDPALISYRDLLEVFFVIHEPTTLNRQGNDRGTQYRSAIYYHSPEQAATAQQLLEELTATGVFDQPIVTEVTAAQTFWKAEGYHQHYYRNHPDQGYCRVVIGPKLAKFRAKYQARLKG